MVLNNAIVSTCLQINRRAPTHQDQGQPQCRESNKKTIKDCVMPFDCSEKTSEFWLNGTVNKVGMGQYGSAVPPSGNPNDTPLHD